MDSNKRQILVTGATGFVGQAVVSLLVQSGYNPRVFARETSDITTLKRMQPNIAAHRGDLADKRSLVAAMGGRRSQGDCQSSGKGGQRGRALFDSQSPRAAMSTPKNC